jgi:hypothetical protein
MHPCKVKKPRRFPFVRGVRSGHDARFLQLVHDFQEDGRESRQASSSIDSSENKAFFLVSTMHDAASSAKAFTTEWNSLPLDV